MWKNALVLAGFLLIFAYIEHVLNELDGRNEPNNKGKKILILGAGMSGISAAKTLHDHGYTNIEILEGSNRVGGRVKSVNLSGYAVELGAQWIYGAGTNPIVKLASKYNLHYKLTPETWTFRDVLGNDLTEYGDEEYKKLKKALEKLDVFATDMRINGSSDMTAEGLLRFCGWKPNNTVAGSVEVFEIDKESGRETPSLTAKYLYYFNVYKQHGDGNFFVVNDTRGYEYLVQNLKEDFLPKGDTRLVLNKKVTKVENWDDKEESKV